MTSRKKNAMVRLLLTGTLFLCGLTLSARSWQEICKSGTLRVLVVEADRVPTSTYGLHRVEMPIDRQRAMLRKFAGKHNLKLEYRYVPTFRTLFAMLELDRGDLIASNLAETPERKRRFLLSTPFFYTQEVLFTAAASPLKGKGPACLKGKTGKFLPGTSYVQSIRALAAKNREVRFRELADTLSHEELIEQVVDGRIDYSVLNECDLDAWLTYRRDVRKLFPLRRRVSLVFAARRDSTELIAHLDKFILRFQRGAGKENPSAAPGSAKTKDAPEPVRTKENTPGREIAAPHQKAQAFFSIRMSGDLEAIQERGYIRMLTTNDAFCCYLHNGQLCGFEYDLAKRFADTLDVQLVTVIPDNFQDLPRYLAEGRGDFIAANFTRSADRIKAHPDLTFCAPYLPMAQVLIGRPGEKIRRLSDLNGRKIFVRRGNDYWNTLQNLLKSGANFQVVPVPEDQQTFSIIRDVAAGKYDLTVADESFLTMALQNGCRVKKIMTLGEEQSFSWVVCKDSPKLAAAVNAFFKKENRSTFFNLCKKRYYNNLRTARAVAPYAFKDKKLVISPYDALFRKYGEIYHFQWYFLAAQAFQETRFQADRVNHLGAAGLMQVLPAAAKDVGVGNLTTPENGIKAGTRYLAKLRKRFPEPITPVNQLCFCLAAYNAGYGHVQDARILAKKMKLDPDVWIGNTEVAFAMLEDPKYYSRAKFGYCRAAETIPYVQNIMFYTYHYRQMLEINADQRKKNAVPPQKR